MGPSLCVIFLPDNHPSFGYIISLNPVTLWEVAVVLGLSEQRDRHSLGATSIFQRSFLVLVTSLDPFLRVFLPWDVRTDLLIEYALLTRWQMSS